MISFENHTDEAIISYINETASKVKRDYAFDRLIMRGTHNWKKKIEIQVDKFFSKHSYVKRDFDNSDLYNLILSNIFTSMKRYDPNKKPFNPYCNSLIAKTFLNVLRNFNTKKRRIQFKDSNESIHIYTVTDSLDEIVQYQNGSNNVNKNKRYDHIASDYDLEQENAMQEIRDIIIYKCKQYMSDSALEIFFEDNVTANRRNGVLAKNFDCSPSRISSIKSRQVRPALDIIKKQLERELDPSQLKVIKRGY